MKTLRTPVVEPDSRRVARYDRGTNKDGPGTALTVFSGAYRSSHLEEVIG